MLKPFRTLRAMVTYQLQPPPMTEFADYNEYWDKRGDPSVIYRDGRLRLMPWNSAPASSMSGAAAMGF